MSTTDSTATRSLIVVDVETTGLDPGVHFPLEVAAINVETREVLHFVPKLNRAILEHADPEAMQINRYFERGTWRNASTVEATVDAYKQLFSLLRGNTLAGTNPRFDAEMIRLGAAAAWTAASESGYSEIVGPEVWHHRLADLSAYAGPALHRAPNELVGLADVCEALGVTNSQPHTALGDAIATAECFRILTQHYADRMEPAS
ncbi:MAG: 3'-5' exonuclease [Actinomycetota bacterium]|nr:3'-5' exonuclease [Actinomycetota bacterium]